MMMISTMNERQRSVMVAQKASVERTGLCLSFYLSLVLDMSQHVDGCND